MIRRRRKPRRERKSPLATVRRTLWRKFSAYVKERDGPVCFSCGKRDLAGQDWQAGHMFKSEGNARIRYSPLNVHSQCGRCNLWLRGNTAPYVDKFLRSYGLEQFQRLSALAGGIKRWTRPEMEELIAALDAGPATFECLHFERWG
jgi:hypothetical protein